MKQALLVGVLVAIVGSFTMTAPVSAQDATNLGTVTLSKAVTAGGQRLAPGAYQVRLTNDTPPPAVGQSPGAERYVEFVRGGKVVAREVATVVAEADLKQILDSPRRPAANSARVETLKGDDYVRVWINRGGNNYIIHLPAVA
jgi:hypothetical protein